MIRSIHETKAHLMPVMFRTAAELAIEARDPYPDAISQHAVLTTLY